MPSGGSPRNAPTCVARPRVQQRGGNWEATQREENRAGRPVGQPIGREEQKVCVYVYARGAMIRVYHSRGVYRASRYYERDRRRKRETGRLGDVTETDRGRYARERDEEKEKKCGARKEKSEGEGDRRRAGG